jgi:flagellar biosynthetic protein FliR
MSDVVYFNNYLLIFMLIFTRWLLMSLVAPFLGATLIPALVRITLVIFLSLISFLIIIPDINFIDNLNIIIIVFLFIKEALLGFIIGLCASLIFYLYELVGTFIDLARSASIVKILVPQLKQQSSPLGVLLFQFSLVLFFSLNLHGPVIKALYLSFERFPILSFPEYRIEYNHAFKLIAYLFEIALRLGAPVIFICFLIDLAFGFLNRVAPHINAYFLSLPAKMMGGLIIFFFVITIYFEEFIIHHEKAQYFLRILLNF